MLSKFLSDCEFALKINFQDKSDCNSIEKCNIGKGTYLPNCCLCRLTIIYEFGVLFLTNCRCFYSL